MIREGAGVFDQQLAKIRTRQAVVGVLGLGYVGLPLGVAFAEAGFPTVGFDVDVAKVDAIRKGESYIRHIDGAPLRKLVDAGTLSATADLGALRGCDAVLICVPTPLNDSREPNLRFVEQAAEAIAKDLRPGQLVVLESTTFPGTTDEVLRPILERGGLRAGSDFFLAFSPEREDPANERFRTPGIPKVVGGHTPACLEVARTLYGSVMQQVVPVGSTRVAELSKLLENIFRCVNIALVNELKMLCDRMGIDVWEVIEAASTKPFGFMPFHPGPGLGGHCIPVDPFYLTWKARQFDFTTRFIELAGEINTNMPHYVVQRVVDALNAHGKSVRGARILVLGVAYKKDIDDLRESPALRIMGLLEEKGAILSYHDPYVPRVETIQRGMHRVWESLPLDAQVLGSADLVAILTDHSCIDYDQVVAGSRLVVDTRNATRGADGHGAAIVKA